MVPKKIRTRKLAKNRVGWRTKMKFFPHKKIEQPKKKKKKKKKERKKRNCVWVRTSVQENYLSCSEKKIAQKNKIKNKTVWLKVEKKKMRNFIPNNFFSKDFFFVDCFFVPGSASLDLSAPGPAFGKLLWSATILPPMAPKDNIAAFNAAPNAESLDSFLLNKADLKKKQKIRQKMRGFCIFLFFFFVFDFIIFCLFFFFFFFFFLH